MKILHFLSLFVVCFILSAQPYAQTKKDKEEADEYDFTAGPVVDFETDEATEDVEPKTTGSKIRREDQDPNAPKQAEVTIMEDEYAGMYAEPSLENISKLYWKKNVLKEENDDAIDNFLRINECDIYEKFFEDDFEWQRIRDAAREMLKESKADFSYKFKMLVPIDLGRYDMLRKGFPLINKTAFKDLRRIEIGGNSNASEVCGKEGIIDYYPRNLILILNKPFSYEFVELDEHVAQAYIIRQKYDPIKRPRELQNKHFDRLAFARVRITFSEYQGITRGSDNFPLAIMFGKLDGIDIFEDADEKRLLTSFTYK